jgi:hypothetical protein
MVMRVSDGPSGISGNGSAPEHSGVVRLSKTRPYKLEEYLRATLGRDAWRRTLGLCLCAAAAIAACVLMVYVYLHPGYVRQDGISSTHRVTSPAGYLFAAAAMLLLAVVLMGLAVPYIYAALGLPMGKGYGKRCKRRLVNMTSSRGAMPTTEFYFKRPCSNFDEVTLDVRGRTLGFGDSSVPLSSVYKLFVSQEWGMLVLRTTWHGGPRDVVADVSALGLAEVRSLVDEVLGVLPAQTRVYGISHAPRPASWLHKSDPWDSWHCRKIQIGKWLVPHDYTRRWRGWHLPQPSGASNAVHNGRVGKMGSYEDVTSGWLPVGSIAVVNGEAIMVVGRNVRDKRRNLYEYVIVRYPEGLTGEDDYYVCRRDQVQRVLHLGMTDAHEEALEKLLDAGLSALDTSWEPFSGYPRSDAR